MLVEIDGDEPLVVNGNENEQAPCVSTEAEHEAAPVVAAAGSAQRATPLTIWYVVPLAQPKPSPPLLRPAPPVPAAWPNAGVCIWVRATARISNVDSFSLHLFTD